MSTGRKPNDVRPLNDGRHLVNQASRASCTCMSATPYRGDITCRPARRRLRLVTHSKSGSGQPQWDRWHRGSDQPDLLATDRTPSPEGPGLYDPQPAFYTHKPKCIKWRRKNRFVVGKTGSPNSRENWPCPPLMKSDRVPDLHSMHFKSHQNGKEMCAT